MPGPFYFAWAGGAIEDQVTLVTNGTTHGAIPIRTTLVGTAGDPISGNQQLTSLASTDALEVGSLYQVSGPGVADGTYFLFDDSILAGLSGSINLSAATSGYNPSSEFPATKATNVGVALATLTQGSSAVSLSIALPAGVYGAFGVGVGETDIPVGTETGTTYTSGGGIMIIGAAFLTYDGSSSGTLSVLAATPHTTDAFDSFGQPTKVTTYTVAAQPVRATTSGQFPMQLTGFPTTDSTIIDGIPSGALTGLMPGLVYNISGNGIPVSTTFVAPASGSTYLQLDLPATASEVNAILTITGPRTPNAPFDASVHNRFDEEVLSIELTQEEGGFATLSIDLKNPDVGLLATGRNLWCWLSWDQNWPDGAPSLLPLFNGRLIGVPRLQAGETVQLQFLARPDDFNAQKLNLANSLSVLPQYDVVWLATRPSPDTALESYSALWHIDRTSLAVTVSDIIDGEAGTIAIGEDASIYDRFALSYGQAPLVAVTLSGTVTWQQQAEGVLDVTQTLLRAFKASGSAYRWTYAIDSFGSGGGGLIQTLSGDGLKSDWPKPGTSIGGGWTLSTRNDGKGVPLCYIIDANFSSSGGWVGQTYFNVTYATAPAPQSQAGNTTDQSNVNTFVQPFGQFTSSFPLNVYKIRMNLEYRANRTRTETVTAVLTAAVQRELSDSSDSDREEISMSSEYVAQGVDPYGALPIGNVAYRSYFQSARGALSFEYLLLVARAKMRARARAVDVTFGTDWRTALPITLRHNVQLTDRRLPGGVAVGKVKSYRLSAGTAGMSGEFTIGCTIGTGEATVAQAGTNSYVDDGYVDDWQAVSGAQSLLGTGDVAFQSFDDFAIDDDGLDLTHMTVDTAVNECVVANGLIFQVPRLAAYNGAVLWPGQSPAQAMRTLTTTVTLDLKPVQGSEFHTTFTPAVSQLALPQTIDLTAATPGA